MKLVERERRRAVLTNRPETRPEQSSRPEPSIRMQPRPDIRDAIEATRRLPERSCPPRRLTRPAWPVAIDRDRRASTPERLPSKPARRSGRASCSSRGLSLFASVASSCLPVHDRFVAIAIARSTGPRAWKRSSATGALSTENEGRQAQQPGCPRPGKCRSSPAAGAETERRMAGWIVAGSHQRRVRRPFGPRGCLSGLRAVFSGGAIDVGGVGGAGVVVSLRSGGSIALRRSWRDMLLDERCSRMGRGRLLLRRLS